MFFRYLGVIIWKPVVLADHPQHPHKLVAAQTHLVYIITLFIKVFALIVIIFAKVGFSFCKGRVELCFDLGPTLDFANEVTRVRSSISLTHKICRVTNSHTQDS